jgi:hypothetical protein
MSVKDDDYFSFQDEAIRKILGKLHEKTKAVSVFLHCLLANLT